MWVSIRSSVILHMPHSLGEIDTGGLWTTLRGEVTAYEFHYRQVEHHLYRPPPAITALTYDR